MVHYMIWRSLIHCSMMYETVQCNRYTIAIATKVETILLLPQFPDPCALECSRMCQVIDRS